MSSQASGYEDVFVDIRAKQKVERTAEVRGHSGRTISSESYLDP